MIHTQYPNRIEITHPDGPHRDQTIELPESFSLAKRRVNRWRPTWAAKVAKGFTIRVVLADQVVETIAPPAPVKLPAEVLGDALVDFGPEQGL